MTFPLYSPEPPADLNAEQSAELSAQLASLARSGLPLYGGLRALADEACSPALGRVLRNLAGRLEQGDKLETAIAAAGSRLPAHLRGLIVAGVRSGRLPIVLERFATLARRQQDLRRHLRLALAYPALLLGMMAALMVLIRVCIASQFIQILHDFGTKLPTITDLYFRFSGVVAWTVAGLAIAAIVVPVAALFLPIGAWLGRAAAWVPILGTAVRADRHAQFSALMAMLVEERVPLPEALRLTSIALEGTMLSNSCHAAVAAVEAGMPLDESLATARFPASLTTLVAWGKERNCLAESFHAAAETFEARTQSQSALLNMLVLPLIYMCIVTFVAFTLLALIMPFMLLVSCLSGGIIYAPSRSPDQQVVDFLMGASVLAFVVGTLILMVVRLWTGPASDGRLWPMVLRVFAWILTALGFLVGTFLIVPALGIISCASLAVIIAMAYGKQVATQQYTMLAFLGAAVKRSMPLETAFAAFGQERGGWMRRRTAALVCCLQEGLPLSVALESVPGVLPPEAVPLVSVGYENGSLGPAIDQAVAARNLYEPAWQSIVPKLGYVCILPAVGVGIVAFLFLKIVPMFEKIFKDCGLWLPRLTRAVFDVGRWPMIWPMLACFWLLVAGLAAYSILRYAGSIRWDLPGMGWLLRRRHVAATLDALSLAAERQQPLVAALTTLASSYPQRAVARRLWAVCDDLQAGGDDFQCLGRRGLLGSADLAVLQASRRNGNLAWAARELADSNRRRLIYRVHAALQVIFPAVIVGYGVLVGMIAIAMFLPLVSLISNLSRP